jgi:hypothetical protein
MVPGYTIPGFAVARPFLFLSLELIVPSTAFDDYDLAVLGAGRRSFGSPVELIEIKRSLSCS